jgi:hypothetical protein
MRFWRAIFASFVILVATGLAAQTAGQAPPAPSNMASTSVRIVSPQPGEKLRDNFVDVRFEVTNPGASVNTPTFQVQLDHRDPVQTTSTDQPFNGLTAGLHTVSVQMVDANGTPINGSRAQTQFTVTPAQPSGAPAQPSPKLRLIGMQQSSPAAAQASMPAQKDHNQNHDQNKNGDDDALPQSGSALPLMSLIGFGVLVGGITSALKTR